MNKVEKRKDAFLSILEASLINCCVQERVLPSIFAAIAIKSSDWGNDINSTLSLNLFNLTADMSTWYGKCLNTSTHEIYENKSQSSDVGSVLIRAYDTYEEAISDYVTFVMNYKRGNGPYKYHVIKNCTDYKTAINKLVRAGFMQDQFYTVDDISKIQELIAIIEEYKLYEWDEKLKEAIKEDEECLRKIRS